MTHSLPLVVVNVMGQFAVAVEVAWVAFRALRGPSASLRHVVCLASGAAGMPRGDTHASGRVRARDAGAGY